MDGNAEEHGFAQPLKRFTPNTLDFSDLRASMAAGWKDFLQRPLLSGFFGFVFVLGGWFILANLVFFGTPWMIIPIAIGFPLIAPFAAAGLYEMSRRYSSGVGFTARDIFTVVFSQQARELGWMAFVVLFIFWVWVYQVRLWLAIMLQGQSFSSLEAFLTVVTTTGNGLLFLTIGSVVGAALFSILFACTVIAMPILLHRDIDFISAMILSINTVLQNVMIMAVWAITVFAISLAAMLPAFLGLIVVLPVLGHATWHLYTRAIKDRTEKPDLPNV